MNNELPIMEIPLDWIKDREELQARERIDESVVAEYQRLIEEGKNLGPIDVWFEGEPGDYGDYWPSDGLHRYYGAGRAGLETYTCRIHKGGFRDARLAAAAANQGHGLRTTNGDKRRAVLFLLEDDQWRKWSDRKIAEHCGVSNDFVGNVRREQVSSDDTCDEPQPTERTGRDGKTYTVKPRHKLPNTDTTTPVGVIRFVDDANDTPEITSFDAPQTQRKGPLTKEVVDQMLDVAGNGGVATLVKDRHGKAQVVDGARRVTSGGERPDDSQLRGILSHISAARRLLTAVTGQPISAFITIQAVEDGLNKAWEAVRPNLPYATCPTCRGQSPNVRSCTNCHRQGWVNLLRYRNAGTHLHAPALIFDPGEVSA